jgi:hypothetical protein
MVTYEALTAQDRANDAQMARIAHLPRKVKVDILTGRTTEADALAAWDGEVARITEVTGIGPVAVREVLVTYVNGQRQTLPTSPVNPDYLEHPSGEDLLVTEAGEVRDAFGVKVGTVDVDTVCDFCHGAIVGAVCPCGATRETRDPDPMARHEGSALVFGRRMACVTYVTDDGVTWADFGGGVPTCVAQSFVPNHAHVDTRSADCDGTYDRTYVLASDPGESGHDFRARVLGMLVDLDEPREVRTTSEGFTWSGPTDEGYVSGEVSWCTDDDASERGTFRDHTAESMGY